MTYEQFLKQLRRIGRQIMEASVGVALLSLILIGRFDLLMWATYLLVPCLVFGLLGLIIYPFKGEE